MLADLIHHVRADLNYAQIKKTIVVYSNNLSDCSLSASIQTMSAKLLLNMIDRIMKLPTQTESRYVLMMILKCFTSRLSDLNDQHDNQISKSTTISEANVMSLIREQGIHMNMPTSEQDADALRGMSLHISSSARH